MKSKVTLKELVGTKIIYAVLLVLYYWMWARRDWYGYYETIQNVVVVFTIVFLGLQVSRARKYRTEEKDELAVQNLRRTDALCWKISVAAMAVIAFAGAVGALGAAAMGYALVGTVLALTIGRFVAFCIMDSKGI